MHIYEYVFTNRSFTAVEMGAIEKRKVRVFHNVYMYFIMRYIPQHGSARERMNFICVVVDIAKRKKKQQMYSDKW